MTILNTATESTASHTTQLVYAKSQMNDSYKLF